MKKIHEEKDIRRPNTISFTGVDCYTDLKLLEEVYQQYSNIEFGICFDTTSIQSIINGDDLILEKIESHPKLPWVAHISEILVQKFLYNNYAKFLKGIPWKRIQFNIDWTKIECSTKVIKSVKIITEQLSKNACSIIPDNIVSRHFLSKMRLPESIHVLSDVSGGKGISPTINNNWPVPYHNFFGYAGGINNDNILDVLKKISLLLSSKNLFFWIDMESSLKCQITKKFQVQNVIFILNKILNTKELSL